MSPGTTPDETIIADEEKESKSVTVSRVRPFGNSFKIEGPMKWERRAPAFWPRFTWVPRPMSLPMADQDPAGWPLTK